MYIGTKYLSIALNPIELNGTYVSNVYRSTFGNWQADSFHGKFVTLKLYYVYIKSLRTFFLSFIIYLLHMHHLYYYYYFCKKKLFSFCLFLIEYGV